MRTLVALAVAGAFFSTLGACVPERDTATPALFRQYALTDPGSPDDVHCFYSCLRWRETAERDACLAGCDGVSVALTTDPCTAAAPEVCTYDPVPREPASEPEDEAALNVIGGILSIVSSALTHADDGEPRREPRAAETHPAPRHEAKRGVPHEAAPEKHAERRYVVAPPKATSSH